MSDDFILEATDLGKSFRGFHAVRGVNLQVRRGTVHALIDALAAEKNNEAFDADGVTLQINVRADQIDRLGIALRDATRGQATLRLLD